MKIVVTGGSGLVGTFVLQELKDRHELMVLDRHAPKIKGMPFVKGDILDLDACRKTFEGADAVIHLAAIRDPLNDPPERVMHVNVMGTFMVHQAAVDAGVRRVVQASSDATYGLVFSTRAFSPEYLPLDEEHPQRPQDPYGLSKVVGEEIARSFTRKCGLETVAVRICFVWLPEQAEMYAPLTRDPEEPKWMKGLWIYTHAWDAARAFRLAAEAPGIEYEAFLISAADNGTVYDTMDLVRRFYPGDIPLKRKLVGKASLADWSKAKKILGYEPRYTWRDIVSDEG